MPAPLGLSEGRMSARRVTKSKAFSFSHYFRLLQCCLLDICCATCAAECPAGWEGSDTVTTPGVLFSAMVGRMLSLVQIVTKNSRTKSFLAWLDAELRLEARGSRQDDMCYVGLEVSSRIAPFMILDD